MLLQNGTERGGHLLVPQHGPSAGNTGNKVASFWHFRCLLFWNVLGEQHPVVVSDFSEEKQKCVCDQALEDIFNIWQKVWMSTHQKGLPGAAWWEATTSRSSSNIVGHRLDSFGTCPEIFGVGGVFPGAVWQLPIIHVGYWSHRINGHCWYHDHIIVTGCGHYRQSNHTPLS